MEVPPDRKRTGIAEAEATYMRRALQLAARGQGRVEPNPMVGCVIVGGGQVIGEGYHRRFGAAHAEIEALRDSAERARDTRGATIYVTLEPCCHHGKTPPCTDALISAGAARVVVAMRDPNPLVSGRGLRLLKKAGIQTEVGLLEREAAELNAPFIKLMRQKRPWVILKWAQSLDGKIATRTGDSRWISDERMRAHAHGVRGRVDAIIVGRETVARDDPLLTSRPGDLARSGRTGGLARPTRAARLPRLATRIILDAHLRTPDSAQLIRTATQVPTCIFCSPQAAKARIRKFESLGCQVRQVASDRSGTGVSLPAVLDMLGERAMTNILVEGGGRVLGSFFDDRLADELHIYIARLLVGGAQAPGPLAAAGPARIAGALRFDAPAQIKPLGTGWFLQTRLPRR